MTPQNAPQDDARFLRAQDALQRFGWEDNIRLDALSPSASGSLLLRAKLRGENNSLVIKVAAEGAGHQLANYAERLQILAPRLSHPRFKVPALKAHYRDLNVLLMEDAKGRDLKGLWTEADTDHAKLLRKIGRWLREFQSPSQQLQPFEATPHLNWLDQALASHAQGNLFIPEAARLQALLPDLRRHAANAEGRPVEMCLTHGDLHLGNLILRGNGALYGIDFENTRLDVAERDRISLLLSVAQHNQHHNPPEITDTPFEKGLGPSQTAPEVRRFFRAFFLISRWSRLGDVSRRSSFVQTGLKRHIALAEHVTN